LHAACQLPVSDALPTQVVAGLARPEAYPDDASAAAGVEWVQTHLSHVFLTAERVYKLRKPVDLDFVRFPTREERNADCLREVALNRRLAPDVYLGVAPVELGPAGPRVGAVAEGLAAASGGEVPEHCVVMRRLPAGRDALSLLEQGRLSTAQLERLALRLAAFHAAHGLGVPAPFAADEWLARCTRPVEESFSLLDGAPESAAPADLLELARERCRRFASQHADRFEQRRREGRAVEAHGDLHLQHVWFESDTAEPLVIDCLEFNEGLRRIDAAAEVAFTAMDLEYRRHRVLGERFLGVYAAERDDFGLYRVVDYFASYRAAVRAKVASLAARDPDIAAPQRDRAAESARRHLELAARALEPRRPPTLVLVGGIVGTGKSTAARLLARRAGVPVVASDRVRRHCAAPEPTRGGGPGSGPDRGLYTPEQRERVYAGVLERAEWVLASGRSAILDATWSSRADRQRAHELAQRLGASFVFVEMRCPAELARQRLARREAAGTDASDAGPSFHAASAARFQPWSEAEPGVRRVLDTGETGWERGLEGLLEPGAGEAGSAEL
jgi:aminoglycoside phosphotransferase family enzyme/predicted kinase